MRKFLRKNLNTDNEIEVYKSVIRVVQGWINYHAVSDNDRRVGEFINQSKRILFKWENRRGRKTPMNWNSFANKLKARNFPKQGKITSLISPR